MENLVTVQYDQKVATIHLNRPDKMNSMNQPMLEELAFTMEEVSKSDAQIVVLTGEGKAFSAGGDIQMMLDQDEPKKFKDVMAAIEKAVKAFYSMPKITIAALNGAAAGLGLSLALAADYVLAQKEAKVAMNFIGIGLIPDGGGHYFMEQRLGTHLAKQVIWEGKVMQATEAKQLGLVDSTTDDLQSAVNQHVEKLSHSPLLAMIQTKKIYREENLGKLEAYLAQETSGQIEMRQTEDHQEGIKAFMEKRKPDFQGK